MGCACVAARQLADEGARQLRLLVEDAAQGLSVLVAGARRPDPGLPTWARDLRLRMASVSGWAGVSADGGDVVVELWLAPARAGASR